MGEQDDKTLVAIDSQVLTEEKLLDLRIAEKRAELARIDLQIERERTERSNNVTTTAVVGLTGLALLLAVAASQPRRKKPWYRF